MAVAERSNFAAYVSTINFILGAGVLGIPVAFVHAGLVTGAVLLFTITSLSAAAMVWEVETIARAEWLMDRGVRSAAAGDIVLGTEETEALTRTSDERQVLLEGGVTLDSVHMSQASPEGAGVSIMPKYYITPGRLDMTDVSQFFLGDYGRWLYLGSQSLYTFVTMWFYTVVVAISLTNTFKIEGFEFGETQRSSTSCDLNEGLQVAPKECQGVYRIYAAVYAVAMILSMCNDGIIRRLQISLSLFADVCIAVMVTTALVALVIWGEQRDSDEALTDAPVLIEPSGFGLAFSAFIFAQLAMHGVPTLLDTMAKPSQARFVFTAALGTSMTMYMALGLICGIFFGSDTDAVITLNWKEYTAGTGHENGFADFISMLVRLFPVVTVSAAFPLNAVALGRAMQVRVPELVYRKLALSPEWRTMACRICVSVPSLVGAYLMTKVTTLTTFAGVLAYVLGFIFPGLLQILSRRAVNKYFAENDVAEEPSFGATSPNPNPNPNPSDANPKPGANAEDADVPLGMLNPNPKGLAATVRGDPSETPYGWALSADWFAWFTVVFAIVAIPYSLTVAV
eukprot:CAMPEP_0118853866 /NCGR_PEP_ID=MMETSP1163-20130328/2294_1 /TAXON_ID=124430 /ORGANISM="Phaeomonas parva, Strain CCMP2877" /LENGTH=567 /DNA_ID=CAMNT_0006786487 /DNA_START=153 /DNA_END=1856 /DNA_ORIENTATION=+